MSTLQNAELSNHAKGQDGSATISSRAFARVSPSVLRAWWRFGPSSGRKSRSLAVAVFTSLFLAPSSRHGPTAKERSGNAVESQGRIFRRATITNTTTVWLGGSPLTPRLWYGSSACYRVENRAEGLRKYSPLHASTTSLRLPLLRTQNHI